MKLAHFTIRARLRMAFGLALAILLFIAGLGLYEMDKSNSVTIHVVEVNLTKIELLEEMSDSVHVVSRVIRSIALLTDPSRIERERPKIADARAKYDLAYKKLSAMPLDEQGQELMRNLTKLQADVRPMNNRFLQMAAAGDSKAVDYLLDVAGPANTRWQETLRSFIDLQKRKSHAEATLSQEAYRTARQLTISFTLVALVIGGFFAVQITRSIERPLKEAIDIARKVAGGDLSASRAVHPKDRTETGMLLRALDEMTHGLHTTVAQVREGAHTLSTHAAEIAQGNMDLSARTEQQASALEQTASSMEELSSTVKNNSENAHAASSMAANTAQIAAHGGEVVSKVVQVMSGIDASSSRIVDIIDVIEGIAFQTNILALNAAVEAARAGEQGRGFAVVASEVRTLAQRSATAAHQIKELIDSSVRQIKEGNELVNDAGTTMQEIVGGIAKVSSLVAEIAVASREQSVGIEQTFHATSELDNINQQNTALVEEIAASSSSLRDEAFALEATVDKFKLKQKSLQSTSSHPSSRELPMLAVAA